MPQRKERVQPCNRYGVWNSGQGNETPVF
jgi:hypothetical protein